MPVSAPKNLVYKMVLPVLGKRCRWQHVSVHGTPDERLRVNLEKVLKHYHTVGSCVQIIRSGALAETYLAGAASLDPERAVQVHTVFRTASIAKAVCALLVMRLQTLGKLSVAEDVSDFWHQPVRNPHNPKIPIPLGSLLSHTAGIADTPLYFQSFHGNITADRVLNDEALFLPCQPYEHFRYSNFAAGWIGSLLESRFQMSFESLVQQELFQPLHVQATFDIRKAESNRTANSYRVLPQRKTPDFDAVQRAQATPPIQTADPQHHFLLASGNLFITAGEMAKMIQVMINGRAEGNPFLNQQSLRQLRTIAPEGAHPQTGMHHGMGLFSLYDKSIFPHLLYGHQGFAYGAVNGFFFNEEGNGFVSFNSGASEQRVGRLSCLNRDLIRAVLAEG